MKDALTWLLSFILGAIVVLGIYCSGYNAGKEALEKCPSGYVMWLEADPIEAECTGVTELTPDSNRGKITLLINKNAGKLKFGEEVFVVKKVAE